MSLKKLARSYFDRKINVVEQSQEPYKSHVPVLVELARSVKPRRIAEFGMGHFSTSVFLDRTVFPSVERLLSFEDDPEWHALIVQKHGADPRFEPRLVSPPIWINARALPASDFDLIFVDDSKQTRDRMRTILALRLAKGITKGPVVVVHDVEQPRYRLAALAFPNRVYFSNLCPQTGVLCWKRRS